MSSSIGERINVDTGLYQQSLAENAKWIFSFVTQTVLFAVYNRDVAL